MIRCQDKYSYNNSYKINYMKCNRIQNINCSYKLTNIHKKALSNVRKLFIIMVYKT